MTALRYAGIGARATPADVLADMTVMAGWLARTGWHLSSGRGGRGRCCVRGGGAGRPADGVAAVAGLQRASQARDCRVLSAAELSACTEIAAPLHPAWERCSPAVRKLHARNAAVLGLTLDRPVDACVAWSPGGRIEGGTGMAIRIAEARGIPVFNLGSMTPRAVCERLAAIRRADPGS